MELTHRTRGVMPLTDAFAVRFAVWLGLAWILARVVEGWLQDWTGWALVLGPPACLLAIGLGERPGARILLALCLVCVLALPESRLRLAGHAPRQALLLQEIGRESAPRQRQYRYLRLWLVDSLGHCVPSGRVLESHDMSEPRARESTLLLPPHAPGQAARLLARPPVNPGGFDEVGWLTRLSCEARLAASGLDQARAMLLETGALEPVLERYGWTLSLDRLVPFAHWCPPVDGAFDTRFFVTDLGTGAVDIEVDATENTRLFWSSARRTLELADEGEISVIFPTRRNLDRLALFGSFAEACAQAEEFPVQRICASQEERDGETWLMVPDGHGYPVLGQPLAEVRRG